MIIRCLTEVHRNLDSLLANRSSFGSDKMALMIDTRCAGRGVCRWWQTRLKERMMPMTCCLSLPLPASSWSAAGSSHHSPGTLLEQCKQWSCRDPLSSNFFCSWNHVVFPGLWPLFLEEGLLLSWRIGLVLSALRDTTGTVARIDSSEKDTSSLSSKETDFQSQGKGEYEGCLLFGGTFRDYSENQKVSCCGCCKHRGGPSAVSSSQKGNKFRRETSYAESSRRSGKAAEKETSFLDSQYDLSQVSSLPQYLIFPQYIFPTVNVSVTCWKIHVLSKAGCAWQKISSGRKLIIYSWLL